jgi:hypothetical protein
MPDIKPFMPSKGFVESIAEQVEGLKRTLKPDELFVGEYVHGSEIVTITHLSAAGRDSVRLIGFDSQERHFVVVAHIASVSLLFRVCKKTPELAKRKIGFDIDSAPIS